MSYDKSAVEPAAIRIGPQQKGHSPNQTNEQTGHKKRTQLRPAFDTYKCHGMFMLTDADLHAHMRSTTTP